MSIPICPECKKPTKRQELDSMTTCLSIPYIYDENDNLIVSNPNITTTRWKCLECGNEWTTKS